jgi:putative glycosyltransferase (TIGR04372 family)
LKLFYKLSKDLISLFFVLFGKNSRNPKTVFLINHRNWGFGHQLVELRYARKLSQEYDTVIICTKKFSNAFLHHKIIGDCTKTITFNFQFSYDIACAHLEKSRITKDVGGSLNEIIFQFASNFGLLEKIVEAAHKSYKQIYSNFPKQDYSDIPTIFTHKEETLLEKKLTNLGIDPNNWFSVLHLRNTNWSQVRNTNIEDYKQSIEYINEIGGQVLLTGQNLTESFGLPYLKKETNEALSLYILKKQRFLLASCSGPVHASFIFDVPVILTNNLFWEFTTWSEKDSSLPKMIRDKEKKEFLTRTQYLELRKNGAFTVENIDPRYELIDNSPEEILDAVKNKIQEIENDNFVSSISQTKFKNGFNQNYFIHYTKSKIDDSYYKRNRHFLEN